MGGKRKWNKGHRGANVRSDDNRFDAQVRTEVDLLFQKKFTYDCGQGDKWAIPKCRPFEKEPWQEAALMEMKEELNSVKSSLSDLDISKWHEHTQRTHRAGQVLYHIRYRCRPELCTQAWCKFHEIVAQFPLIPEKEAALNTLHLCEAPGAFITSLNHYLYDAGFNGHWNWIGNTLNPYYEGNSLSEMIDDDRLIIDTMEKWHFGADNTGNIMNRSYLSDLQETVSFMQPLHLVTADGSIDCQNSPDQQEAMTAHLHFCEAVLAMNVLTRGGSLVLKMFTMFEHQSICLLYLLNMAFEEVTVVKPATSKPGNSELYVVCLDYQGTDKEFLETATSYIGQDSPHYALFDRDSIPVSFMDQHRTCCEFFTKHQIDTIEENKRLFEDLSTEMKQHMQLVRECCASSYQERFNIKHLNTQRYVVPQFETIGKCKQQRLSSSRAKGRHTGSYNARIDYSRMTLIEKISIIKKYPTPKSAIHWFSSPYTLEDSDCSSWRVVQGKPLRRINCSKFFSNELSKQYFELREGTESLRESSPTKAITKELCDCSICHGSGDNSSCKCTCDPEHKENTTEHFEMKRPEQCTRTADCTCVHHKLWEEMKSISGKIHLVDKTSIDATCLLHKFMLGQIKDTTNTAADEDEPRNLVMVGRVNEYSTAEEHRLAKQIWIDFYTQFKKLNKGDHFLFPVSNCWSRFCAGIVYIMYTTFSKIGTFTSPQDNERWFVGLNHMGCPPKLISHLEKVNMAVLNTTSSVLQFVSMHNLLESHFHFLLSTANNTDLKTSINDLLDRCTVLLNE